MKYSSNPCLSIENLLMQFVRNGPDIPERLLQAHEEGKVVFFCGAGISYPAGLPGFSWLVNRLFKDLGQVPNAVQQSTIKAENFDTAIGLLNAKNATITHESLLTLGKHGLDTFGWLLLILTLFLNM